MSAAVVQAFGAITSATATGDAPQPFIGLVDVCMYDPHIGWPHVSGRRRGRKEGSLVRFLARTLVIGFDWDAGNRDKCQKHGVSVAVIESLFRNPIAVFPDPAHSEREERFKAIGRAEDGRNVLIVFTLRMRDGQNLIRPISARYMRRKESEYYEKEAAKAAQR